MAKATGGHMAREVGGRWEPKYPDVATEDSRRVGEILAPEIFTPKFVRLQWVPAPPDSHLLSFAFSDARYLLHLKRDDGSYYYEHAGLPRSRIHVKFKEQRRARSYTPVVQYYYGSFDHPYMARVWELLKGADHPGKVLHAHLEHSPAVEYHQEAVMG